MDAATTILPDPLGAVLALAERGLRLHPLAPGGKTPLLHDWPSAASRDAITIRRWVAEYAGANWGVACGPASGVWVLDVDGDLGRASLQQLIQRHGKLPETLTVRTGKGGHLYWRHPENSIRNSASKIADGLDVRGEGGYVVVPPSIHPSGRAYEWVRPEVPIADAPDWLVQMATAPLAGAAVPIDDRHGKDTIIEGKRNAALASLAGTMRRHGMTPQAIEAALLAENAGKCRPPLAEAEVRAIARSISRYPIRTNSGAPENRCSPQPPARPRRADIVSLAGVQPRDVEWLWRPYLPAGMLAMLSGDPGAGKTYVALAIAAALTTGHVPLSHTGCATTQVLYMSNENDPACVVRPRFDSLGGNAERLHLLRGSLLDGDNIPERGAVWLTDVDVLRDALNTTLARLIIVDPIQSYLGAKIDAHRSNETRPVLDSLAQLAQEYRCCVLLLRHLSKARGGRAIHAGLGSVDLTGAVRCEMLAGCSADDPQQRAMVQVKSNVGEYGPALGYIIDDNGFTWTGESTLTQSDLLAPEPSERDSSSHGHAVEWLRSYLSAGPRTAKEVEAAAMDEGLARRTVIRAKKDAGVVSQKVAFGDGWLWKISEGSQQAPKNAKSANTENLATFGAVGTLRTLRTVKGEL